MTNMKSDNVLSSACQYLLLVLLALDAFVGAAVAQSVDETRPNIVVILVDDLGWMDLGCQGSDFYQTPHIDRLAGSGMRFTNGYAACAVCSPTRAAMLTGRYPHRIGVTDWIRPANIMQHRRAANCGLPGFHDSGRALLTAVNRHELPRGESRSRNCSGRSDTTAVLLASGTWEAADFCRPIRDSMYNTVVMTTVSHLPTSTPT